MKKMIVGVVIVVGVLIVAMLIRQGNTTEEGLSVHDLNWDDIEGMNERIYEAFYTDPPYVYDAHAPGLGYLNVVLGFFRDNLDSINDGESRRDLGFKVKFTGITGEESFLGDVPSSAWQENNGEFELSFSFDRSLAEEFFDVLNMASREQATAENPDVHNEEIITLLEVDWDALREDYEAVISAIVIQGIIEENMVFNTANFESEHDDLSIILGFLEENQNEFNKFSSSEEVYIGVIHFWTNDEEEPRLMAEFIMDEELNRRLMGVIGEDAWELVQERKRQEQKDRFVQFNYDQRILLKDIDWDELRNEHEHYIDQIAVVDDVSFIADGDVIPDIELVSGDDRFEKILEWLGESQGLYSEEEALLENQEWMEGEFLIHIRFRKPEDGLENETYTGKSAWFFVSYDYWDELIEY